MAEFNTVLETHQVVLPYPLFFQVFAQVKNSANNNKNKNNKLLSDVPSVVHALNVQHFCRQHELHHQKQPMSCYFHLKTIWLGLTSSVAFLFPWGLTAAFVCLGTPPLLAGSGLVTPPQISMLEKAGALLFLITNSAQYQFQYLPARNLVDLMQERRLMIQRALWNSYQDFVIQRRQRRGGEGGEPRVLEHQEQQDDDEVAVVDKLIAISQVKQRQHELIQHQNHNVERYDLRIMKQVCRRLVETSNTFSKYPNNNQGGDPDLSNMNFVQFSHFVAQFGFVTPTSVLQIMFDQANRKGNGRLELEEVIEYFIPISYNKPLSMSRYQRAWTILQFMAGVGFFWTGVSQVVASLCFVYMAFFVQSPNVKADWILAGATLFTLPLVAFFYFITSQYVAIQDGLQQTRRALQSRMFWAVAGAKQRGWQHGESA